MLVLYHNPANFTVTNYSADSLKYYANNSVFTFSSISVIVNPKTFISPKMENFMFFM